MLNSEVTPLYAKEWMRPEWYFGGLTLLMIVVTSAFYFVAARFNKGLEEFQASVGDIDRV
jgi:hypothetical protein